MTRRRSKLLNLGTQRIFLEAPEHGGLFSPLSTKVTKDDIRDSRNNVVHRLGFLNRVLHGANPKVWLKELRQRAGKQFGDTSSILLDSRPLWEDNPSPKRALYFGKCSTYRPPLRGAPGLEDKTVLLIDRARDVRASVLRSHGVEVHEAESLQAARFLWQPKMYDLILLDVRRHLPGDALEFYEQIREASPRECFAFLVGPPVYLSRAWPNEFMVTEREPQHWEETVNRFSTAA